MTRVEFSGITNLANDMTRIPVLAKTRMVKIVREQIKHGERLARLNAQKTSGSRGKRFPRAMSSEMHAGGGLFGNSISGEYGPDRNKPQGGMAFEDGPGPQTRPHRAVGKTIPLIRNELSRKTARMIDGLYWP